MDERIKLMTMYYSYNLKRILVAFAGNCSIPGFSRILRAGVSFKDTTALNEPV